MLYLNHKSHTPTRQPHLLLPKPNQLDTPLLASDAFFSTLASNSPIVLFVSLRASSNFAPASLLSCDNFASVSPAALPSLESYSLPFTLASATFNSTVRRTVVYAPSQACVLTASSSLEPAFCAHASPSFLASLPVPGSSDFTLAEARAASPVDT